MSLHHFKNRIKVWFQWKYLSYKRKKMLKAESFEESIKRYKKNPILLKSHNYNKVKAIGKYTKEDGLVLFNNN